MSFYWLRGMIAAGAVLAAVPAAAQERDDIVGTVRTYTAVWEDTLMDIARAHNLGFVELAAANPGVDPWIPGEGTRIVLPTAHILPDGPRRGIVLNQPEMRLYYFGDGGVVSHPVGIGQDGRDTPKGATTVTRKAANPTWYPPASVRAEKPHLPTVVPPGPANPLGTHALYLGWPAYLIHGTNKPDGVGRRVSFGCIRMYPEDIVRLFAMVPVGTPVRVVDQPVKAGWRDGDLYLEVHPTLAQVDQIEIDGTMPHAPLPDLTAIVRKAAGAAVERVDWTIVDQAARERRGIPVRIAHGAATALVDG